MSLKQGVLLVKKSCFTLIELMIVIGIAGMLAGIAVPAYNKIINGNQTDRAAAALKLALEQAQVRAISSRKNVALIIPNGAKGKFYGKMGADANVNDDDTPDFNSTSQVNYYLGSARMAYVEKNSSDEWKFVRWVPGSKWLDPFKNTRIVLVTDDYDDLPKKDGDELDKHVSAVYATSLYDGSNDGGFVKITGIPGGPTEKSGIVFSPFGGMRNTRKDIYIAIAECRTSGTNLAFPAGSHPLNYIVLDVNRLNGKVSYHVYEQE